MNKSIFAFLLSSLFFLSSACMIEGDDEVSGEQPATPEEQSAGEPSVVADAGAPAPQDAGTVTSPPQDAGSVSTDAGATDAGVADAGTPDAGPEDVNCSGGLGSELLANGDFATGDLTGWQTEIHPDQLDAGSTVSASCSGGYCSAKLANKLARAYFDCQLKQVGVQLAPQKKYRECGEGKGEGAATDVVLEVIDDLNYVGAADPSFFRVGLQKDTYTPFCRYYTARAVTGPIRASFNIGDTTVPVRLRKLSLRECK